MFNEDLCPTYLVSDKEGEDFDEKALTNFGTLREMTKDLCTELKHPVAVFDFIRLKNGDSSKFAEKIESDINFFSLRNGCKLLRQCAGKHLCEECDKYHARCMAADVKTIRENIERQLSRIPDYFYDGYSDLPPIVLEGFDRPILEYHCPMMGYRELIFPILHRGRVFGVLFVGQISVQSRDDAKRDGRTIDHIRKLFFQKNEPSVLFADFAKCFNQESHNNNVTCEELKRWIMESDQNPDKYDSVLNFDTTPGRIRYHFKTFTSDTEYHDYLREVCSAIGRLEKKLTKNYENKRAEHFDRIVQEITKQFDERHAFVRRTLEDRNRFEQLTAELKEMWSALKQIAKDIQESFPRFVRSITVYGDGTNMTIGDVNKKCAQFSYPSGNEKTTYDFTSIRGLGTSEYVKSTSIHSETVEGKAIPCGSKLLDGLTDGVPREDCVLVACRSIAIFLRVRELDKHQAIYEALAEAIGNRLGKINSSLSLCRSDLQKEKHILTIRMYRHETAHISERLSNLADRYYSGRVSRLYDLANEKRWLVANDMQNTISLLSDMADNVGLVTGSINEYSPMIHEQEDLEVFDMLYKWRSMFRYQLVDRSLDILVPRSNGASDRGSQKSSRVSDDVATMLNNGAPFVEGYRQLSTNARLFELLVYNLVDNAAKYAYRGSNIYLMWSRTDTVQELRVISFGPEMDNSQDPFSLYVRGNGSLIQNVQGEGIGLYAVKRISELLGFKIEHKSEKVFDYYLPFIKLYRRTDFGSVSNYRKISDRKLLIDPLLELMVVNHYEETMLKRVTKERLMERIELPTYCTSFRLQIRAK